MEICEYNFLFTIIVLNSMALMYVEFNAASLVIVHYCWLMIKSQINVYEKDSRKILTESSAFQKIALEI